MTSTTASGSSVPASWTRSHWFAVWLQLAAYAALFAAFYPPIHGIEDEVGFINQALAWSRGSISAEGAGFPYSLEGGDGYPNLGDFIEVGGRHVGQRHPGRSVLAIPFIWAGGLGSVFWSGMAVHVAVTLAGALIFATLGRSPLWSSLLLWHPTLTLFSRTMIADEACGLFLLLAVLAVVRSGRPGLWSGLAIGGAALMRYQGGAVLPLFAAAIWRCGWIDRRRSEALRCVAAAGLVGALIVAFNLAVQHSFLGRVGGHFTIDAAATNLKFYAVALMVLWPLMLLAPLLDRSKIRWFLASIYAPTIIMFIFWYFYNIFNTTFQTIVVGQRLIQAGLPALIVCYGLVLDDRVVSPLASRWRLLVRACVAASVVALVALTFLMFRVHQGFLDRYVADRVAVARTVPEGSLVMGKSELVKLFQVPYAGLPRYRWWYDRYDALPLDYRDHLDRRREPWYYIEYGSNPPTPELDREILEQYRSRYLLEPLPGGRPLLKVYRGRGLRPGLSPGADTGGRWTRRTDGRWLSADARAPD